MTCRPGKAAWAPSVIAAQYGLDTLAGDVAAVISGRDHRNRYRQRNTVTGPANAKTELIKHIHRYNPQLIERIAGVETVDHPSDGAFIAHARRYFRAADRMSAQRP